MKSGKGIDFNMNYYHMCYVYKYTYSKEWNFDSCVGTVHPIDMISSLTKSDEKLIRCHLISYQEITEEEYLKFKS